MYGQITQVDSTYKFESVIFMSILPSVAVKYGW